MRSGPPRGCVIIVFGGLTAMLSFMLVVAWRAAAIQDETSQWPTCDGIVIDSRVETRTNNKTGTSYEPEVRYRYTIDGVTREGTDISFNPISTSREDAYTLAKLYPIGQTVRVWHKPGDPASTVLDASPADWSMTQLLGVVLAFVTAGLVLAAFWPWLGGEQTASKPRLPPSAQ